MKRLILTLIVVFTAGSLFAGDGKSCDVNHKAKSVSLTGTVASGANDTTVFRVANSDKSYTICHKSKANVSKLGADGATLQVTGKVVSCDEAKGDELVIETAKKI
jgi:hypothetical protein